jgi:hypothetical protein
MQHRTDDANNSADMPFDFSAENYKIVKTMCVHSRARARTRVDPPRARRAAHPPLLRSSPPPHASPPSRAA